MSPIEFCDVATQAVVATQFHLDALLAERIRLLAAIQGIKRNAPEAEVPTPQAADAAISMHLRRIRRDFETTALDDLQNQISTLRNNLTAH